MKKEKGKDSYREAGQSLLEFIDRSPTPYHAVSELGQTLKSAGFRELDEADAWDLVPGGRYFAVRNGSSLAAFVMGSKPPETAGFKIVGAHTDSPNLRLKPNPIYEKNGYAQLGVEVYGGVLLSSWADRDLSLAGRVVLKSGNGLPVCKLLKIERPILRIPLLAIHLNRSVNEKGLVLNPQTHLPPILTFAGGKPKSGNALKDLVARETGTRPEEILSLDLSLYDTQKSAFGGPDGEFLFAPRLDNLASCHAATAAFLDAGGKNPATRAVVFYDHEEVGSQTAQGGGSPFLKDVLERAASVSKKPREAFIRAVARSLFISADMAHAVHPNYPEMHDANHMPAINKGPAVKTNAGQRYATDGVSSAHFETLCERAGVTAQKFVMRSDLACGSAIGPVTAANLGIRTADVGNPMLSMHSAREMAGTKDHGDMIRVFREFFTAKLG
ncbi:MAG: M18 family aminopeptidase [Nitrospinae bacterium]|nr:M18 family aminopeptidase [Nitrospinota bacterium]